MDKRGNVKILLVYPETGIDPAIPQPPHSLLPLAGVLEAEGYSPKIIDARIDSQYTAKLKNELDDAKLVGVSCMTGFQILHGLEISKFVKDNNSSVPIVWGGVHPTFLPIQTLENKHVDIVVRGEGEITLSQLVRAFSKEGSLKEVRGITYKTADGVCSNADQTRLFDLNSMPVLPWHLVEMGKYVRQDEISRRTISFPTSRGCPYRCSFCYNLRFHNRRWRGKSSENVLKEIDLLVNNYEVKGINFTDDEFFIDKKRVSEICEGLIDRSYDLSWTSNCRVDRFSKYDDSFIALLRRSGCKKLSFGGESGSQMILKLIEKDITVEQIKGTVSKCKAHEIMPQLSFMMGVPTETEGDFLKTLDLIDELKRINEKTEISGLFFCTPFPGTPLFDMALNHGFVPPKTLEEWGVFSFLTIASMLPWLDEKRRSKMRYVAYLVRMTHFEDMIKSNFRNPLYRIGYQTIKRLGKIRWKRRYFGLPIEGIFLDWYFSGHSQRSRRA